LILLVLAASVLPCASARADTPYLIECTGADATEDIQDALKDSRVSYILLSTGVCAINSTLKVTNRSGLRFEGAGRGASVLAWAGDEAGPMFSLQNTAYASFSHFDVCAHTGKLEAAFDMYEACHDGIPIVVETGGATYTFDSCAHYSPGAEPGSHENTFTDVGIRICDDGSGSLDNGIRILLHPDYTESDPGECGEDEFADCGNEGHFFNNVHVTSFTDSAFVIEGRLSVGNTYTACHCDGWRPGMAGSGADNPNQGKSCVRSGAVFGETGCAFSWFGGIAENLGDSVFVMQSSPEVLYVSGLRSLGSRMLLRNGERWASVTGRMAFESIYFDTQSANADEDQYPGGKIIHVTSGGSLSIRDSYFGRNYEEPTHGSEPVFDDVSFCWDPPEVVTNHYDETDLVGEFVFEGNAVVSSNSNPFSLETGAGSDDSNSGDCVYPTRQMSNVVLVHNELAGLQWRTMPQHKGVLTSADPEHSVKNTHASHELFDVSGTQGYIAYLTNGFAGQQIALIGTETDRRGSTINNGMSQRSWFVPLFRKNIWLPANQAVSLRLNDTLFLVKGPRHHWYTVGRSDN